MTTDKQVADSLATQGKTIPQEEVPPQTIIGTFTTIDSLNKAGLDAMISTGDNRLVIDGFKKKFGCTLNRLPVDKWQEAGEWFTSLATTVITQVAANYRDNVNFDEQTLIIPRVLKVNERFADECKDVQFKSAAYLGIMPPAVDGGAEGITLLSDERIDKFKYLLATKKLEAMRIIPPSEDQLVERKLAEDAFNKSFTQLNFEAEQRRQTVQAEAMVNLAVGVVLLTFGALTDVKGKPITRQFKVCPEDLAEFQNHYTVTQEIQSDGGFIISVSPKEV